MLWLQLGIKKDIYRDIYFLPALLPPHQTMNHPPLLPPHQTATVSNCLSVKVKPSTCWFGGFGGVILWSEYVDSLTVIMQSYTYT